MTVNDRPILFSGDMVKAILDGRKSQTRRVVKPQPVLKNIRTKSGSPPEMAWRWDHPRSKPSVGYEWLGPMPNTQWLDGRNPQDTGAAGMLERCPFGVPGDHLWVRETFCYEPAEYDHGLSSSEPYLPERLQYKADGVVAEGVWKPSIHMPRWASRITLEIAEVRVERLQDMSEEDAIAEGSQCSGFPASLSNVGAFAKMWNSINGKKHPWSSNPWVWVISFKVV